MFIKMFTGRTIELPSRAFEVSGPGVTTTAILVTVFGVLTYVAGFCTFITQPVGSTYFWLGGGGILTAALSFYVAYGFHQSDTQTHQTRWLRQAETFEEYQKLLEKDQEVHYHFRDKVMEEKELATELLGILHARYS